MKIQISAAVALFTALGFTTANKWNVARFNDKVAKLLKIIDDPDEIDPSVIADKDARKLFDQISAAHDKKEEIVVVEDADTKSDAKPEKLETNVKTPSKPAKKPVVDEDDSEEVAAKKSIKTNVKVPSKPAAKTAPAAKKSPVRSEANTDKFGARENSGAAAINAVLTRTPKTTDEIVKETDVLKSTVQEHLWKLRAVKKVIDRNEKGWFLLPKAK